MIVRPRGGERGFFPFLSTGGQAKWREPIGCVDQPPLVPKLCFGTHFREALLRWAATSKTVCEDTRVWERFRVGGAKLCPCRGPSRASGRCVPKHTFDTRDPMPPNQREHFLP